MSVTKPAPRRLRKPPTSQAADPGEQFGEAFIADFLVVWREHGPAAIKTVAAERPQDFVRAGLAILARDAGAKVQAFDYLDDEQLAARVRKLQRALADCYAEEGPAPSGRRSEP